MLPEPKNWQVDCVVYHHPCSDGYGAAWVAHKFFQDRRLPQPIFVTMSASGVCDAKTDWRNRNVLVVDITPPLALIHAIKTHARTFVLLDHHETGRQLANGQANCHHDMSKSGIRLAWDFFFPGVDPPPIVAYTEDRDLWKFSLPDSRIISTGLRYALGFNFSDWNKASEMSVLELKQTGITADRVMDILLREELKRAILIRSADQSVGIIAICTANTLASDLGHLMLQSHPEAVLAVIFSYDAFRDNYTFSIRADDKKPTLPPMAEKLAKMYNGGGHPAASGCAVAADRRIIEILQEMADRTATLSTASA